MLQVLMSTMDRPATPPTPASWPNSSAYRRAPSTTGSRAATRFTAARLNLAVTFNSRFISSSPEKLSGVLLSHFWGALHALHSKTSGGKGGKGGNLRSFGNRGLFDGGATRRKPAETGGNWRKPPAETLLGKLSAFSLFHFWGPLQSSTSPSLAETAKTALSAGNDTAAARLL
jgi:hypothetical protein